MPGPIPQYIRGEILANTETYTEISRLCNVNLKYHLM